MSSASITGFETLIPPKTLEEINLGRPQEMIQLLADLGYLNISTEEGIIVEDRAVLWAIELFRHDYTKAELLMPELQAGIVLQQRTVKEGLNNRELKLLQLLTSLDGEFMMNHMPPIEEQSIRSRVIHYRLQILGVYDEPIDASFSKKSQLGIQTIAKWLAISENEAFHISGNIPALIQLVKTSNRTKNMVVYFQYEAAGFSPRPFKIYRRNSEQRVFKRQLRKSIRSNSRAYKDFNKKVERIKPDFDFIQSQLNDEMNRVVLRLLQIRQWMSGYYQADLDGKMEALTFGSLLELAKVENEFNYQDNKKSFVPQAFIGYAGQNYWALNIHYLLDRYSEAIDNQEVNLDDLFDAYEQTVVTAKPKQLVHLEQNMNQAWTDQINETTAKMSTAGKFVGKLYYGVKSVVKALWKGIKTIFKLFVKAMTKIANYLKSLVRVLFREIREGVKSFALGMKFLFGKRTVTTGEGTTSIMTKYDFDMDCLTVYSKEVSATQAEAHVLQLQERTKGLEFAMKLTGKVIKMLITLITGGWQMLLIKIGLAFKNLIKSLLGELKSKVVKVAMNY